MEGRKMKDLIRTRIIDSGLKAIQKIHPDLPDPEGFPALIRKKRALMFWEYFNFLPIWLSGAILKLEMAANSTYWKANLCVN